MKRDRQNVVDTFAVGNFVEIQKLFGIEKHEINADFGRLYGAEFAFLNDTKPHSIFMAKGSDVAVYKGAKLVSQNF